MSVRAVSFVDATTPSLDQEKKEDKSEHLPPIEVSKRAMPKLKIPSAPRQVTRGDSLTRTEPISKVFRLAGIVSPRAPWMSSVGQYLGLESFMRSRDILPSSRVYTRYDNPLDDPLLHYYRERLLNEAKLFICYTDVNLEYFKVFVKLAMDVDQIMCREGLKSGYTKDEIHTMFCCLCDDVRKGMVRLSFDRIRERGANSRNIMVSMLASSSLWAVLRNVYVFDWTLPYHNGVHTAEVAELAYRLARDLYGNRDGIDRLLFSLLTLYAGASHDRDMVYFKRLDGSYVRRAGSTENDCEGVSWRKAIEFLERFEELCRKKIFGTRFFHRDRIFNDGIMAKFIQRPIEGTVPIFFQGAVYNEGSVLVPVKGIGVRDFQFEEDELSIDMLEGRSGSLGRLSREAMEHRIQEHVRRNTLYPQRLSLIWDKIPSSLVPLADISKCLLSDVREWTKIDTLVVWAEFNEADSRGNTHVNTLKQYGNGSLDLNDDAETTKLCSAIESYLQFLGDGTNGQATFVGMRAIIVEETYYFPLKAFLISLENHNPDDARMVQQLINNFEAEFCVCDENGVMSVRRDSISCVAREARNFQDILSKPIHNPFVEVADILVKRLQKRQRSCMWLSETSQPDFENLNRHCDKSFKVRMKKEE